MGVSVELGTVINWTDYLKKKLEDHDIDEDERDEWERRFDGYQMKWNFDTSAIVEEKEGAIDAACLYSETADGGYCVGLTYKGTNSLTAELYAKWTKWHQI